MIDRLMADGIVAFHLLFIVFATGGGLLVLRWRWLMALHLPAAAWAVLVEVMCWGCPLTYWENHFRERYGAGGYSEGFLDHYLIPIIYPDGLQDWMRVAIGVFVLAVNLSVYGYLIWHGWQKTRRVQTSPSADRSTPVTPVVP
jgi:hypothetical protein